MLTPRVGKAFKDSEKRGVEEWVRDADRDTLKGGGINRTVVID